MSLLVGVLAFLGASSAASQFLPPGLVNFYADIDLGADRWPSHVIAPDGTIHVVWASNNAYGPTGWDPDIYYARNPGSGWTFPEMVNSWADTDSAVDDLPRLALGPDGVIHVVWQSQHAGTAWGSDWDVFYRARDPVAGWGTVEVVNADAASDNLSIDNEDTVPSLAARADGSVLVLYQAGALPRRPNMHWRLLTDSGWSNDLAYHDGFLGPASMALRADGAVEVVFSAVHPPSSNRVIEIGTFTRTGGWMSLGVQIADNSSDDIQPAVAVVGSGAEEEVHYVWASNDGTGGIGSDYDLKHFVYRSGYPSQLGPYVVNSTAATDGASDDLHPSICFEPGGVLHVVWQSPVDLLTGTDVDVYHADNGSLGKQWSPVGLLGLNAPFDGPTEDDFAPEIRCDSRHILSGMWWSEDDLGGAVGNDDDVFHALGLGRLYHRPRPVGDWFRSDGDFDGHARVVVGGGIAHVVWENEGGGGPSMGADRDIYYVNRAPAGFSEVEFVNGGGGFESGEDTEPDLAVDGLGRLHAVWSSNSNLTGGVAGDTAILYSLRTGGVWSPPEVVGSSGLSDGFDAVEPRIGVDASGGVHVVWYRPMPSVGGELVYARRIGSGWSAEEKPTVPTNVDWSPESFDLAVAPGGTVDVVWTSGANQGGAGWDTDVFWSRRVAGVWSPAQLVNDYGTVDGDPDVTARIAYAPDGEVYAVWASPHDTGSAGSDFDLYVAKRDPGGVSGAWQPTYLLLTHFGIDTGDDRAPELSVGSETLDVAWESDEPLLFAAAGTDLDIFHARVPRLSAMPADVGVGVVNPNAFADVGGDSEVSLGAVEGGSVFFAWQTTDSLGVGFGPDSEVMLGRLGETEVIFADGFETGDTALWSHTVP